MGAENVLVDDRQAGERTGLACGTMPVCALGGGQRRVAGHRQQGVQARIQAGDPRQHRLGQCARRKVTASEALRQLGKR